MIWSRHLVKVVRKKHKMDSEDVMAKRLECQVSNIGNKSTTDYGKSYNFMGEDWRDSCAKDHSGVHSWMTLGFFQCIFNFYVYVWVPACMDMYHGHHVHPCYLKGQKRMSDTLELELHAVWTVVWPLESISWSCAKALSILTCRAISLAPVRILSNL